MGSESRGESAHPAAAPEAGGTGHGSAGRVAVVAAMSANLAIAVTKFIAWLLTGASSMLAESIHSLADTTNQVLLLGGGRDATQHADAEHPFGYGAARYVNAFLVAVILFSLGGMFALYEAYHKWHQARLGVEDELLSSRWWWVPLLVLVLAAIAEATSLRTAVRESRPSRGRMPWSRFVRAAKAPELPVVLLEDSAALVGIVFALFGVGMTLLTRNPVFDVAGTALIGLLLIAVAITLGIETRSLLIGEAASPEAQERIREALSGTSGVERIIHMKTLHVGPDEVLLAAKISVEPTESARRVAEIIDAAEARIRAAEHRVTSLYLEPDIYRADYRPGPRPRADGAAGGDARRDGGPAGRVQA